MILAQLVYDPTTDQLVIRVPATDGEGDVTLLSLDCKTLSDEDKRRLRHVRAEDQAQRPPGNKTVTR
jgi:hypothetical protein